MDQEERYKTQQRPAPGKKKLISAMQAGDTMAAVQLCGKGFGGFGWQQTKHETEVYLSRKESQQHLGLY